MGEVARRILSFEAGRLRSWAAWAGRALLVLGAVVPALLPLGGAFHRIMLIAVSLLGLAGALAISALPARDRRSLRTVEVGWTLMFLLHLTGHIWDFYDQIPPYDKVLHAVGGVVTGVAVLALARGTTWFWDPEARTPFRVFFLVVATVALAGVTLELVEYGSDRFLGAAAQTHPVLEPLDDTMIDLAAEVATGILTGLAAAWWTAREPAPDHASHPRGRGRRMQHDS